MDGARASSHFEGAAARSARLVDLITRGRSRATDTAVFVLANLKTHESASGINDVETEFLSERELDQVVRGFRDAGFYCDPFTDHAEFCQWTAAGGGRRFPLPYRAVYAIAQPGHGASRHAVLAGIAELFGLTLLTPPAYEACLLAHKAHSTVLMRDAGVPTPDTWVYLPNVGWSGSAPPIGAEVIAKPALESASIGMDANARFTVGMDAEERTRALARAVEQAVVVQRFIPGREVEVAVVNDGRPFALDPVGIALDGEEALGNRFLDYATVYRDGYDFFDFGAKEPSLSGYLRAYAERAALALGAPGISRFDFRITEAGEAFCMDMSGKPHLTVHSSVAFRFRAMGFAYADVFATLVGAAAIRGAFLAEAA